MTSPAPPAQVAAYVAAVRAHLQDLSAAEQEELCGGLEADLAELVAETGAPVHERLGDPATCAADLRAAAGLPPAPTGARRVGGARGSAAALAGTWQRSMAGAVADVQAAPWWPAVRTFLLALQPAWWVLRAWVAVHLLALTAGAGYGVLPLGPLGLALLLVAVAVSVELGRGRWGAPRLRPIVLAGNVLAVLALPLTVDRVQYVPADVAYGFPAPPMEGLWRAGEPVGNVFAYDAAGRPLQDVQLFDQAGRPLDVAPDVRERWAGDSAALEVLVPAESAGAPRWNVYPLRTGVLDEAAAGDGAPTLRSGPVTPPPPLVAVPPLGTAATTTPTPTAAPTVTATSTPSATPGGTVTPR